MSTFEPGDRVRVDIPDEEDPDFSLHGQHGEVIQIIKDDADSVTGRGVDQSLFRVELDSDEIRDFRARDLRPPLQE